MERKPRELYRMPLNTDEWRKMTSLHTLEEKGALLEACLTAWAAPLRDNPPATIPDDDDALETLFGRKFGKVQPVIRQHFRPCAEHKGFLRCAWLLRWYDEALARYHARAIAGQKGGRNRGKRPVAEPPLFDQKGSWANSSANSSANSPATSSASSSATAGLIAGLKQLKPKPNGVITPHTGAAPNARDELPSIMPLRPLDELEAWAAGSEDRAAVVQLELDKLCAHWPDRRQHAERIYRHRALDSAFATCAGLTPTSGEERT